MLRNLADEQDFTVFSVRFENPFPERIKWVRIPAPLRPLALLFISYHLLAPLIYLMHRLRNNVHFDLVQMVESNLSFGDVSYSHFCHTAYLKQHWHEAKSSGLRGFLRSLDHRLHAWLERRTYRHVKKIVAPSRGLARELALAFPFASDKICILPNAIDVERLDRPASFDRDAFRQKLGFTNGDIVFLFVALGQFERKGLPLLLEALSRVQSDRAKLLVVGGQNDLVAEYRERANRLGLGKAVLFAGMQSVVHPYLWAADAFAFPSSYETFSLVAYEAAAAGLPLIAPPLNGIEEIIRHGENGFVVGRTVEQLAEALQTFLNLSFASRLGMGRQARGKAAHYDTTQFVQKWREFYQQWESAKSC